MTKWHQLSDQSRCQWNRLILDANGVEYKRNTTHFKKFLEKKTHDDPQKVKPNNLESKPISDDDEKIKIQPPNWSQELSFLYDISKKKKIHLPNTTVQIRIQKLTTMQYMDYIDC